MQRLIDSENWSYARLQNGAYSIGIFIGADEASLNEGGYIYYLTLLENEEKEIFQKEFHSLFDAINFANNKYHDWKFQDLRTATSGEGCGSCSAH